MCMAKKHEKMFNIINYCVCACSVMSNSLRPHGLYLPGSSVHRIFQARILEWVVISYSRGSSQPKDRTRVSCTAGGFFTSELPGKGSISIWHLSARITLGHSGLMVCCGIKKKNNTLLNPLPIYCRRCYEETVSTT